MRSIGEGRPGSHGCESHPCHDHVISLRFWKKEDRVDSPLEQRCVAIIAQSRRDTGGSCTRVRIGVSLRRGESSIRSIGVGRPGSHGCKSHPCHDHLFFLGVGRKKTAQGRALEWRWVLVGRAKLQRNGAACSRPGSPWRDGLCTQSEGRRGAACPG